MAFHWSMSLLKLICLGREKSSLVILDCYKTRMTTSGSRYFSFEENPPHPTFKGLPFLSLAVLKSAVGRREACTVPIVYSQTTNTMLKLYRLIALEQMGNLHGLSVEFTALLLGLCWDMVHTNRHQLM